MKEMIEHYKERGKCYVMFFLLLESNIQHNNHSFFFVMFIIRASFVLHFGDIFMMTS